jgi:small-conductance mechanosensitive channel
MQMDSMQKAALMQINILQNEIKLLQFESPQKQALVQQLQKAKEKDSLRMLQVKQRIDSLRTLSKGWPIKLISDTLHVIYIRLGQLSAKERAEKTTTKVLNIAKSGIFIHDSLRLIHTEISSDLYYKSTILLSITDLDALWEGKSRTELGNQILTKTQASINKYIQDHSLGMQLKRFGFSVLVLLMLILLIWLVFRLYHRAEIFLASKEGHWFKGLNFSDYEFINASRQLALIKWMLKFVRMITILLLIYLAFPVVFSFFPWTQDLAERLLDLALKPVKQLIGAVLSYLPNLVIIALIVLVIHYLQKLIRFIANEIHHNKLIIKGFYADWALPTAGIIRFLLYAFMFVVIFPYLPGSDSVIFKGVSVFIGVLFSLGSSSAISNAVAGFVITYMRPFQNGDRVKIGDFTGEVVEKTMLVTRIKSTKNEMITVPNATILNSSSINYSASAATSGLIVHTTVTIGYDAPWRKVHKLLVEAAMRTTDILKNPKPFVLQTSLDDFYVSYQINAYTNNPTSLPNIYSELHSHIQDCFNEGEVEIMSPHYRAARDGNHTTIPDDYLPSDYHTPGFNVNK